MKPVVTGLLAASLIAGSAGLALAASPSSMPHQAMHKAKAMPAMSRGEANRMTAALNTLEASGYGDFTNFHQSGQNFAATVTQNGKQFGVTIDPGTHQVTRQG